MDVTITGSTADRTASPPAGTAWTETHRATPTPVGAGSSDNQLAPHAAFAGSASQLPMTRRRVGLCFAHDWGRVLRCSGTKAYRVVLPLVCAGSWAACRAFDRDTDWHMKGRWIVDRGFSGTRIWGHVPSESL
jgi:hypothetical protein